MDLVIRYGLEAGFEDEALALARRLFAHFDEAIVSLTLVPVAEHEFAVFLGGELVHSRAASGRDPRLSDIVAAVESRARTARPLA